MKLINYESEDFFNNKEDLNIKYMLFFWTFYSSKNPKKMYYAF